MGYNSLDEKYRAKDIGSFLGNQHIKTFLQTYKFDSPLMFEGPSGCGKTTLAYIIANKFTDSTENIIHVNCAKVSTKAETEELIDNLNKTSIFGKKKVLILDEIHKLSDGAEQAWLVPLGELRDDRLVIACTTSTESVKATLLRRFTRLVVKPLIQVECSSLIDKICYREGFSLKPWAKALIFEESLGIPANVINFAYKIKNAQSIEEARQLLDNSTEEDIEVLELFKLICNNYTDWYKVVLPQLNKALKKIKPEELRIAIMNLIGGRLGFVIPVEDRKRLCDLHDYLMNASTFTKSPIVVGIFRYVNHIDR